MIMGLTKPILRVRKRNGAYTESTDIDPKLGSIPIAYYDEEYGLRPIQRDIINKYRPCTPDGCTCLTAQTNRDLIHVD